MSRTLNPNVAPFVPQSVVRPSNQRKSNKVKQVLHHLKNQDQLSESFSNLQIQTQDHVQVTQPLLSQEDFPSISTDMEPIRPEREVFTAAGFRSFRDVALSAAPASTEIVSSFSTTESPSTSNVQPKKKKKKRKKTKEATVVPHPTSLKPPPLTLDRVVVSQLIAEVSKKKNMTSGLKPKKQNLVTKKNKKANNDAPRNLLDSTAPKVRKGKTREVPKAKKPTKLKRLIFKERELRKTSLQASGDLKRRNLESFLDTALRTINPELLQIAQESSECIPTVELEEMEEPSNEVSLGQKLDELIHGPDFRSYCNQCLTDEIDLRATELLSAMVRFQDRMHDKDPTKARARRRHCCGLREVSKYLAVKKVKCLLMAPDIQLILKDGVLDQTVSQLIDGACKSETPIVFCLKRQQLGYLCKKKAKVSCVAILNPSGADEAFNTLIQLSREAREEYKCLKSKMMEMMSDLERNGVPVSKQSLPGPMKALKDQMKRQTYFWFKTSKCQPCSSETLERSRSARPSIVGKNMYCDRPGRN